MNKKILLISSDYTGHGHKSIAQAILEQLGQVSAETEITVVNGFTLGGRTGKIIEHLYLPVIKYTPLLWKLFFFLTSHFPSSLNLFTASSISKRFLRILKELQPDLIVSVHPGFVGSLYRILEKNSIRLPVVVIIADLVTFSGLWADSRSLYTVCPSSEAENRLKSMNIPNEKIKVINFPLRKNFNNIEKVSNFRQKSIFKYDFLLFANAYGKSYTKKLVISLLKNFDCSVTILTGRDEKLKKYLSKSTKKITENRLTMPGYVENIEAYLLGSDLLITRASPNILMEAIHCGIPTIVTGKVPGQEKGNPDWILNHQLGLYCPKFKGLINTIYELLDNDMLRYRKIQKNQKNFSVSFKENEIAEFLYNILNETEGNINHHACLKI